MAAELEASVGGSKNGMTPVPTGENGEPADTRLLLQAFEMFTHASSSLESAFSQLQEHAQKLTQELEEKNRELERSLWEKQQAQNYLRTILERLPCGVFVLDEKGNLTLCNPMASEVLEQAGGQSGKRVRPFLNARMRSYLSSLVSADAPKGEVEIPFTRGNRERILATSGTPLIGEAGEKNGTLHIIRDITEMKALQEQAKRVERLSAMGEMAAELAHEIRNPLGSIELFASLLVRDLTGDLKALAENIRIGIRSLNTIVSNMLQFANPVQSEFAEVDFHEVLREILAFTGPLLQQRNVTLQTGLDAEFPVIAGDRELLKQMLLNLIFNAMKAMPAQGSLAIRTRNTAGRPGGSRKGLELEVQDSGIGIPAGNLDRIFDPFFTTNKNGTGLGLSVVHQIVERHSGKIRVASEVNRGTTFTITFDRSEKE